jgi:hypothetical protein
MKETKRKPHHNRRTQVYDLLDKCLLLGKTSHYEMQRFVKRATGIAPSPKLIVKWKRSRNLHLRNQNARSIRLITN